MQPPACNVWEHNMCSLQGLTFCSGTARRMHRYTELPQGHRRQHLVDIVAKQVSTSRPNKPRCPCNNRSKLLFLDRTPFCRTGYCLFYMLKYLCAHTRWCCCLLWHTQLVAESSYVAACIQAGSATTSTPPPLHPAAVYCCDKLQACVPPRSLARQSA